MSALSHRASPRTAPASRPRRRSRDATAPTVAGCGTARWRCPEGELDLVVELPGEIVFVEVKARRAHAAEAVTARQWARIGAAASRYLAERTDGATPCRFDLALVDR